MPIHLIGHSRGASVVSEISRLLGQQGIWVRQMTTLDPHPVRPFHVPPGTDAPIVGIGETVLFADNFYEDYVFTQPNGQPIDGAYNENLSNRLPGGYGDPPGTANHSDVHLWYHGTINTGSGASNGDQTFTSEMRNTWYKSDQYAGQKAGFYYSRLGGGHWALDGFLFGYNDGGHNILPDTRVNVSRSANEWPSLISLIQNASGSIQAGTAFPVEFIYQSYDSGASVTLSLDTDRNPYNGNETALTLPAINPQPSTARTTKVIAVNGMVPTPTAPGFYYVYGKITNPYGTRYLYAAYQVRIVTAAAVTAATITSLSPTTLPTSASPQLINIYGSNFKPAGDAKFSMLIFRDPNNTVYVRTPVYVSANQLQCNINIPAAVGTWSVIVTNAGLTASNTKTFETVTPPPNTGSLTVNLSPSGAVSAGAQWRVDGGSYRNHGDTATGLTPGSHTVSFKAVSGYTTPADKSVSINSGVNTPDSGTYTVITPSTYTLTLNFNSSQGAVAAWPSGGNYTAGAVVQLTANANYGYHFVSWGGDVSGTANPTTITMNGNKTVSANFALGDPNLGTTTVTIQPVGAAAAGVTWGWNENDFRASGTSVVSYPGSYILTIHGVDGWIGPSVLYVTVTAGQTANYTVTFTQDTTPGLLTVMLSPPDAVTAGAKWRVNSGAAQGGGSTIFLLPGTNYSVTFDSVPGWTAPPNRTVQVQRAQTTIVPGNYTPPAGQPVIAAIHPNFGARAGGTALTIEGVNFTAPAMVLVGGKAATNVSVVSASQIVCLTPSNSVYGTMPVVVQTPGGNATNLNGFTYGTERGNGIELVTSLGGRAYGVAVQGNYAYVGEGSSLLVVNISNPSSPSLVGRLAMPGKIWDIALDGQYAYVANGDAGLQVVDMSNPSAPSLKGFYTTTGWASGIAIMDGRAYVADGGGLEVFDLGNPTFPVLVSATNFGSADDVAVQANTNGVFAYVVSSGYLSIVDVSLPTLPSLRSQLYLGGGFASSVAVAGDHVFVACFGRLRMVNVSNPDAPVDLGAEPYVSASSVAVANNLVYAAAAMFSVVSYSGGSRSVLAQNLNIISHGNNSLISGSRAFLSGGTYGLVIVDVSNSASPSLLASFSDSGLYGDYTSVAALGNYLYAGAGSNLKVFNVNNPALPAQVGQYGVGNVQIRHVLATNSMAYVIGSETRILSLANPESPTTLSTIPTTTIYGYKGVVSGNLLFLAGNDSAFTPRFLVVDVSTPSSPQVRSALNFASLTGTGPAMALAINGNKAVVGMGAGQLKFLDISNFDAPIERGGLTNVGLPTDVALSGDGHFAYAIDGNANSSLRIIDVSNLANPWVVTNIPLDAAVGKSVTVQGNLIYAVTYWGVYVFDATNPTAPVLTHSYSVNGAFGISLATDPVNQSGTMYLPCFDAGLVVVKFKDTHAPQIFVTDPTSSATYTNTTGSFNLGGTALDDTGLTRVTWSNDRGGGGDATGTTNWSASGISLQPGTNVLTATAFDQAGNSSNDTLTVIYQTPKQSQAITFPALADKTFGDTPMMLAAAASSGLPVGFSVVSGSATVSNNVLSLTGAGSVTVRATQPGNDQFNAAPAVTNSFNVAKADQAIIFGLLPDKVLGDAPFVVTATAGSGLPVAFSIVSGQATLNNNVVTLNGAGTVIMSASQAGNTNFNSALEVERSFVVAKVPQFIAFGALSRQVLGDAPFPLTASASSGLPVNFTVLAGPAVVSGNILTITGAGLVVLRASQAGDATYAPAPNVDQVLSVAPGNNVITDAQQLENGMFTLRFYGEPGTSYVVQASTNLVHWQPVATNQISGLGYLEFTDTVSTNYDRRFYRIAP